ncbi:latent transforming growth factor beta-binding protein [Corallococcus sp. bb12-1]|uniref:latent transforming growth factor beta-binding protein n=1 Tax=Corallococcus sp. bb12-1 TaxID=2996784 RepID=UPI00226DBA6B|nr:latent transforming growth factor beta-binding protein [Corallococcus sp. bb12-1]MCY1042356.1 latent transforming growth factor beta-binding protein [Corallococcus sp. bb12-1]
MRLPGSSFLAVLLLLTAVGCPLDIQVRDEADAGCSDDACVRSCSSDRECPDGQRCDGAFQQCEPGARLTERCADSFSCPGLARCEGGRCSLACGSGCPVGYRCGPEDLCVEICDGLPPATLDAFCSSSLECGRCGFCVDSGGVKKCHQPCRLDVECPGGAPGVCRLLPGGDLGVCRLP